LGFRSCNSHAFNHGALKEQLYSSIIASDGIALALLRKEFPQTLELPSYHVEYAENGDQF
jgi:hypothetical protein